MAISGKATVLIVEDDLSVAQLQRRRLEVAGYEVVLALTAAEALELARAGNIDLAILDYLLHGGVNGLDLFEQFKAEGLALPVIMVTGIREEETVIRALRAGVSDFVPKSAAYLDYLPDAIARVLKQVRTEKQLAESEARFASFMDNSPAIAYIKDEQLRLVFVNELGQRLFALQDYEGKTAYDVLPPDAAERVHDDELRVLATGCTSERIQVVPLPDGTPRDWLTYRFPIYDIAGRRLLGCVALDVTERKRAEEELRKRDEQLRHSQKLESLGILAGGVAHEFNNLLQCVQGYTRYAMEGLAPAEQRFRDLEVVLDAAQRAAILTRQLLGFSRREVFQYANLDPNQIVRDAVRLMRPLIGGHIHLELALGEDVPAIHTDPTRFQQLLMNLCVNARDAMPDGGQLIIKTHCTELDENSSAAYPGLAPGLYLTLTVSDTGCGMTREVLAHAFDPFFTTKEIGKGTGLGLATVHGVVEQHKGTIRVSSAPGAGTAFTILLPAAEHAEPVGA